MGDIWSQLLARVKYLRELYHEKKITLKPGEGLTLALDEAEACAKSVASPDAPTSERLRQSANACHVVWVLHDGIKACIDAGLEVKSHLGQLTTGTTDFGKAADAATSYKTIYFKDFEAELFVAAELGKAHLPVQFLDQANDPRGEMHVEGIFIEVKHPNSQIGVNRLMRKFQGELRRSDAYGVFVVALEDAFSLADQDAFPSRKDFIEWQERKRDEIESFGHNVVLRAVSLSRIAALVQTSSSLEVVGDETRFVRYSNSLVFDQRHYPPGMVQRVERIASVFNSQFRRYSQVRHLITPSDDAERPLL